MAMLDGIVGDQGQPFFSLDWLRDIARRREGMSPSFRARSSAPDPYAAGLPEGVGADIPTSAPMLLVPGAELPSYEAPRDPYRELDAAAAKNPPLTQRAPVPFAGMLNQMGLLNAPGSGGLAPGSPAPALSAPVDVAAAPGGSQTADAVAIPPKAKVTQSSGVTPPTAARVSPGQNFLDRISNVLSSNPSTLLALGAGFAGAQNVGQGMSRAFSAAVPAIKQDQALQLQRQGIEGTYKALVQMGVSPEEALAASLNPDIMKAMTQRLFGMNRTWGVIAHDDYGNPIYGMIDTTQGSVVPASKITVPRVQSKEEVLRLPKGSHFIGWDGNEYVR